jgi:hypothetical protein
MIVIEMGVDDIESFPYRVPADRAKIKNPILKGEITTQSKLVIPVDPPLDRLLSHGLFREILRRFSKGQLYIKPDTGQILA